MKERLTEIDSTLAKEIQSGLNKLGFNCGTVDGIVSPNTEFAFFAHASFITINKNYAKKIQTKHSSFSAN